MGMNIKNKEAYRLTKQLSKLTGEKSTTTVTEAVRERLLTASAVSKTLILRSACWRSDGTARRTSKSRSAQSTTTSCCTMSRDCQGDYRYVCNHRHSS